jgi:hypothetical protein
MSNGFYRMSTRFPALRSRRTGLLLTAALLGLCVGSAARAQEASCQADFQRLTEKRMAQIGALNKLGKAGKGKMDPIAACPVARNLAAIEGEMLGYMTKNKDWCAIPDAVLDNFKQARAKTQNFASQACGVAAKVKKMQEQQRQQAANPQNAPVKLPAGPL